MTIELPVHLELALASEAARRGTTPQALATELITSQLPLGGSCDAEASAAPSSREEPVQKTMLDRWKSHLESLPKPPADAPQTNYSQDTGRKFAEALVEKRRQGRL